MAYLQKKKKGSLKIYKASRVTVRIGVKGLNDWQLVIHQRFCIDLERSFKGVF